MSRQSLDYRTLAELRYRLRRFLRVRELAARAVGVEPQQYLVLLQLKGLEPGRPATIGTLAERLQIRHHSGGLDEALQPSGRRRCGPELPPDAGRRPQAPVPSSWVDLGWAEIPHLYPIAAFLLIGRAAVTQAPAAIPVR